MAVLLSACGDDDSRTGEIAPAPRGLKTCTVSDAQQTTVRRYPSVLQPASTTVLSFEVPGRLQRVNLDVGQRVSEGDVIASLDPKTFQLQVDNAKAALTQAEVLTKNAKDDYDRKAALLDQGVTTQAQTDQAMATWKSNEAQEEQARKQLETAEQDVDRAVLKAPFDGIISSVDMQSFTNVTAGAPVATIYADDEFESAFTVSFDVVNQIAVGKQATVRVADDPSIVIPAHISELGSSADSVSSFPVVVKLDKTSPLLKSGMAVEISLEFAVPKGIGYTMPLTVLPMAGVADVPKDPSNPASFSVFVYDKASGTVVKKPVKVGGIRDNQLIIVDGLSAGEKVACAGVSFLRDGMKVTLLPEAE